MSIILTTLFKKSRSLMREQYMQKELEKLGNLRAGSSGVLTEDGEVIGNCHRKSHLRQLGLDFDEPTEDKLIMFDLGYASEDIVYQKLVRALPVGQLVLREEEIPIEWTTTNGTKVTGRPDMVICETVPGAPLTKEEADLMNGNGPEHGGEGSILGDETRPILGIELKSVHSLWTARDILFGGKPKTPNLIQAAHYMWKLGIPYKLVYSAYSQLGQGMAGTSEGWVARMFPKPGDPLSDYVEYTYYELVSKDEVKSGRRKVNKEQYDALPPRKRDHGIKHIRQFEIVYDLSLDAHGRVQYKLEDQAEWTPTIITTADIERYFEAVSTMAEGEGDLGPRPSAVDALGGKAGYSDCDYCPLRSICDSKESAGYSQWLESVREIATDIRQRVPRVTTSSKVSKK